MLLRAAPLVLMIVVLAECAGKPACDAMSCQAGCCDANGACVAGNTINSCGKAGSGACAVCAMGEMCLSGACKGSASGGGSAAAGGGSGALGGGTGGGGLSAECPDGGNGLCLGGVCVDGVCVPDNSDSGTGGGGGQASGFHCSSTRTVASFEGPVVDAGYELYNWLVLGAPDPRSLSDGGTWEALELQLNTGLRPNQPIPGPVDLDGGDENGLPLDYFKCGVCPLFFETCRAPVLCGRTYLGISGHVDVKHVDLSLHGTAYATMSNVTLVEWDFTEDHAVPDSGCVVISAATFDAGW